MREYYKVNEILKMINKQFGYVFEGQAEGDNLINSKTWNKYFREFFEDLEDKLIDELKGDELENLDDIITEAKRSRTRSSKRYQEYREDLVAEIIEFRKEQLIKHFNSNRITIIDHDAIKMFENFAEVLGVKVDESIYHAKIFKSKYKQIQTERIPTPTKEEIQNKKEELLNIIFEQLIDEEKINDDICEQFMSGKLIHGNATPLEPIEYNGELLGFKIDAKKYLKESVKKELANIAE